MVSNSPGELRGKGRVDPYTEKILLTHDTKLAIEEGLKSFEYGDVLSLNEMYTTLPPIPNTTHGLQEYVSHRVESR
jgi:hypothetical protein